MPLTWAGLAEPLRRTDSTSLAAMLLAASEQDRVAFAPEVEHRVRARSERPEWPDDSPAGLLALAVIACMPTAARAAALLTRRSMRGWGAISTDHFLSIARARRLPWIGDLGVRLAGRLPARDPMPADWTFCEALLLAGDAEPPATEGAVRGWLWSIGLGWWDSPSLVDGFRGSPWLDTFLPRVFEIDGIGLDLPATGSGGRDTEFATTIATLVADGRLDRKTILEMTVGRLARGDRPAALRPFTGLHDELAPTVAELAMFAADYVRLLQEAPSPVAALAQRSLRALDDAGMLDLDTLLEASGPTLLRSEKVLVKAQLTWLDRRARRTPERAADLLETVATALGHPALDIHERALAVIDRHLLRVAADSPARARIAALTSPSAEPVTHASVPPPVPQVASVLPIETPAELAEEVIALLHQPSAVNWERVLAGLVALAPAGLADALGPVLNSHPQPFREAWGHLPFLGEAIRAVLGRRRGHVMRERLHAAACGDLASQIHNPASVLALRVAEVAARLVEDPIPCLLAAPTYVTGSIDADVLVDRMARFEAEGRTPWQLDLQQALLRLPRTTGPEVLARADALTSPAGRQLAAWLRSGGLPDPVSTRFEQCAHDPDGRVVIRRVVVNLEPARTDDNRILLEEPLVTLTRRSRPYYQDYYYDDFTEAFAMVLPHHREVTAAWALPAIAALADRDQRDASLLPLLADCSGPPGPALTLAVAYGLGARHQPDRVAAVDAFLVLAGTPTRELPSAAPAPPGPPGGGSSSCLPPEVPAAHQGDEAPAGGSPGGLPSAGGSPGGLPSAGGSFAAGVGVELGDLCSDGTVKLGRVVPALTDALQAGAAAAVWELLRAALPPLLPTGARGLPDLLELATRAATSTGARDEVPGLTQIAARGGGSRSVREAKRLQAVLSAP
ncbi:hypothetical protein Ait01nite_095700 [Actinoplanes italicus]|uniref:DUF7824 domain-containing protein n=1 Tax=Actinoplanes italicus TaxID=113567 RepID=A0A2T0JMQ2_9ACTN|nr:DUF6493 family protein [Actinoplanes italicus]PRX08898.1 hypothetical protein CLV67_13830 [Actinoplanes italicus]GIE36525.1 hypothetical protein Ait01nite_095700 [Actinoplanes italicus]